MNALEKDIRHRGRSFVETDYGPGVNVKVGGAFEFHLVDGSFYTPPADPLVSRMFKPPYFGWLDSKHTSGNLFTYCC